jgi:multidrug resistance efflux pump
MSENKNTWIQAAITGAKSELVATSNLLDEMFEKRASIEAKIEDLKQTQLNVLQKEWNTINDIMAEQVAKTEELERIVRKLETVEFNLNNLGKLVDEKKRWEDHCV